MTMIRQYSLLDDTKYKLFCVCVSCGKDLAVAISGGTKAHVGAVSLAVYEPERDSATVSTICAYTHRDDAVATTVAKKLATALRCSVTVTAGIHIDDASKEEVELLLKAAFSCCDRIIKEKTQA